MPVGVMLKCISSREITEWMAFYRLEPWGTAIEDNRAGIVASTIANVNRDPKQRKKPYEPSDFTPKWGERETVPEQTPEQQQLILQMLHAQFKARNKG